MHKPNVRLIVTALFAIGFAGVYHTALAQAQPTDTNAAASKIEPAAPKKKAKSDAEAKGHGMPFHGKLQAVDKVEKTVTIKGKEKERVFQITSHTKLSRDGKPATLADAVVGEDIGGFAREISGGKYEALSLRFGAKAPGQPKPKKTKDEPKPEPKPEQKPQ